MAAGAPALSQPAGSAPPSRRSSLLSSFPVEPAAGLSRPQVARSGSRTPRTPRKPVSRSQTDAAASQAPAEPETVDESRKRASDVTVERLQDAEGNPPPEAPGEVREALSVSAAPELFNESEHPLKQIARLAEQDKKQPLEQLPEDHGSWDGRWPLPSRSEWMAHERAGVPWPSGSAEVNAVQTARKEYKWHEMSDSYKESFRIAAADGWKVWVDNSAICKRSQGNPSAIETPWRRSQSPNSKVPLHRQA